MNKLWHCHVSGRFGSCGWDFATFEDAMAYAKQQANLAVVDAKRFPEYLGILSDYRASISGPDSVNMILFHNYWSL